MYTELMTFLHLSDFHLPTKKGELGRLKVDPCKKLDRIIELLCEMNISPTFSIITGDLSQTGTVESYGLVKEYLTELESLGGQVLVTMGNRDNRCNFRQTVLEKPCSDESKPYYYSETIGDLRVIGLDSKVTGSSRGAFDEGQLEWLKRELENHPEKPTIIAFHHPIVDMPLPLLDGIFNPSHVQRFYENISDANILAVLCGHLHHNLITSANGVLNVVVGSIESELTYDEKEYKVYESSSFNIVTYRKNKLLVKPVVMPFEGRLLFRRPIQALFKK